MLASIGRVKAPSGKYYEVFWDSSNRDLYIQYTGSLMPMSAGAKTHIGKATSAGEAMTKAEAAVYNK